MISVGCQVLTVSCSPRDTINRPVKYSICQIVQLLHRQSLWEDGLKKGPVDSSGGGGQWTGLPDTVLVFHTDRCFSLPALTASVASTSQSPPSLQVSRCPWPADMTLCREISYTEHYLVSHIYIATCFIYSTNTPKYKQTRTGLTCFNLTS